MPSVKVYPPETLPGQGINEDDFNIWQEQLLVYILQDDNNQRFVEGGTYANWSAEEEFPGRIRAVAKNSIKKTWCGSNSN